MKLYIEQKFFSLWGRYSVLHEHGGIAYTVQGYPALGKKMVIRDANNKEVGVHQQIWHITQHYEISAARTEDALDVLMLALAISALKTMQKKGGQPD